MTLGSADARAAVTTFLTKSPSPTTAQVVGFLSLFTIPATRAIVAQEVVATGADPAVVSSAMATLAQQDLTKAKANQKLLYSTLALVSATASGFHGYRRNNSLGWGLVWFVMGSVFPIITPVIGLAQGFGQERGRP
jgi:hypothetical protein